jgi:hypothetical protein
MYRNMVETNGDRIQANWRTSLWELNMFFDLNLPVSKLPVDWKCTSRKAKEPQGGQSVTYSALEIASH